MDMPRFIALRRYFLFFFFYKLKACGNPASSKPIGAIFPTAYAQFVSLCHILVILVIFQILLLLLLLKRVSYHTPGRQIF
jgi:hypothetical protein